MERIIDREIRKKEVIKTVLQTALNDCKTNLQRAVANYKQLAEDTEKSAERIRELDLDHEILSEELKKH